MPANLTPQYLEAEAKFKQAKSVAEKVKALEGMMAIIPKHKGTEKLRAQLKSRMAKLKEELHKKPTVGKAEQTYYIKKEGAAQVVLLGLPNSGKSSFFTKMTSAASEVAEYPYTTQKPISGMMRFENLWIQLVDTPPIQMDHTEPGFPNMVRLADALLLLVDLSQDPVFQMEILLEVLAQVRIRIVERGAVVPVEEGWVRQRVVLFGNKCDIEHSMESYRALENRYKDLKSLPLSAKVGMNLEEAKREVYRVLDLLRVYTKAPGQEPDFSEPVILKQGSTVEDVAFSIHKDFAHKLRYARIWGSGKFEGQMVKRHYPVTEGDVIELHL